MLAVSPLRSNVDRDESDGEMENLSMGGGGDFAELSEGNLLDCINFDDLFAGINDGDVLPDLEMDSEMMFAEFSLSASGTGGDESELTSPVSVVVNSTKLLPDDDDGGGNNKNADEGGGKSASSDSDSGANSGSSRGYQEIVSKRNESVVVNPSPKQCEKVRKSSSAQSKNPHQGKKKVKKVDWTPELHSRFVQAVEQLGVDKAVPSRILELMGINCLTRHNIASHLQKYRSHRKHLLAREAEAASWSQRRQLFGAGGRGGKREVSPWLAPTIGFPRMSPMPHFRPLHVWGHPSMDHSFMHVWPKPLPHPPSPQPPWAAPSLPPSDPSYWHQPHHQRAPKALTPGTPCFPQPLTTTRFGSPTVPGFPPPPHPHAIYKVDPAGIVAAAWQPPPRPLFDFHPSKESVDAAIGDVLSKPWLPLPLGLKAPATESVMGELQRQGIPKIPPSLCLN